MNAYLVIIVAILAARYLLDLAADVANVRHLTPKLPDDFRDTYDDEKYRKSQDYLRDQTTFHLAADTVETLVVLVFMLAGGFNGADGLARRFGFGPILTGLVFTGLLVAGARILKLPFEAYQTFVIEERYGFNRTTVRTFLLDLGKTLALTALIGGPCLAVVLWFFGMAGPLAWVYCWAAVAALQVLLVFLAPYVIMPLFNRFVPLKEGELRAAVEDYAARQQFRMRGVFTLDGSKRSSKTNAFFTGFGRSRRIVLFDTLIAKHTIPELLAVIAHEMGHYKRRHIPKAMLRSLAVSGLTFYLLSLFIGNASLFAAFKMEHLSIYASLVFFGFLYAPISMAFGLVEQAISRSQEYEADAFAARTTGDARAMASALKKLSVDNLSNLTPHPLKVLLHYSHPPVRDRLRAMERLRTVS